MASQAITTAETHLPQQSQEAERFGLMQRQARMFAMSPLIPEALRKGTPEQAMANCYIAMSIADRMGEDRMTVMQNIHIIHGTAGFKSSYMIARANSSGKFSEEIEWEEAGEGPTLSVTAFATLAKSGRRIEMTVDMAMAKAEGWASNKKYTTMPKVMLRYRSAAFLIRLYAPEVMLGHQTIEEVEDVRYAGGPDLTAQPLSTAMLLEQASEPEPEDAEEVNTETGEIVEDPAIVWKNDFITEVNKQPVIDALDSMLLRAEKNLASLAKKRPELHDECLHAIAMKRESFGVEGGRTDEQHGDQFDGSEQGEGA